MNLLPLGPAGTGPAAEGPAALLLACHERIRRFTALADRLATAQGVSPAALADAARDLLRYFTIALPLHAQDEDLSIAPRLLAAGASAEIRDALVAMTAQHPEIDEVLEALGAEWRAVETNPAAARSRELEVASCHLGALFESHLAAEERLVFPALPRLLEADALRAIEGEIAARRGA